MKVLLMLLVILGAVWFWRTRQTPRKTPPGPATEAAPALQDMVSCDGCGVHIPRDEAIAGQRGRYCCVDHQRQSESE